MTDFHFRADSVTEWTTVASQLGLMVCEPNDAASLPGEPRDGPVPSVDIGMIDDLHVTGQVMGGLHINVRVTDDALASTVASTLRLVTETRVYPVDARLRAEGKTTETSYSWPITDGVAILAKPKRPKLIWYGDPAPEE